MAEWGPGWAIVRPKLGCSSNFRSRFGRFCGGLSTISALAAFAKANFPERITGNLWSLSGTFMLSAVISRCGAAGVTHQEFQKKQDDFTESKAADLMSIEALDKYLQENMGIPAFRLNFWQQVKAICTEVCLGIKDSRDATTPARPGNGYSFGVPQERGRESGLEDRRPVDI